jgi:hypothetical protein
MEYKRTRGGVIRVTPLNADFWGFQRLTPEEQYRAIVINAAVFPRALFDLALFDSKLRYGSEEIDMARHATALGYRIVFDASLRVDHYPSEINRAEYAPFIDASRMYATAKDYWYYQRKPFKALAYALLAPPKLVLSNALRKGWTGMASAVLAARTAFRYFRTEANSR